MTFGLLRDSQKSRIYRARWTIMLLAAGQVARGSMTGLSSVSMTDSYPKKRATPYLGRPSKVMRQLAKDQNRSFAVLSSKKGRGRVYQTVSSVRGHNALLSCQHQAIPPESFTHAGVMVIHSQDSSGLQTAGRPPAITSNSGIEP